MRAGALGLVGFAFALALAAPATGQEPGPLPSVSASAESAEAPSVAARFQVEPPSTGGTFLRSLLVPGWGHAATGSYLRGGLYAAGQGISYWMLWKSLSQRGEARTLRAREKEIVKDGLRAQGITDPDSLRILAEENPALEPWDDLLETRDQQVEDWIALSLFLTLLAAADAFVSAHLMDFPEPLDLRMGPRSGFAEGGVPGVEIRLSVPLDAVRRRLTSRR